MRTQMALEEMFTELARNENLPTVILCDRGLMDGSAYVSEEMWMAVLDEVGLSSMQLRDKRYDGVIHMVTAADGAETFYNKGNEARYENI
jgi:AAA domain